MPSPLHQPARTFHNQGLAEDRSRGQAVLCGVTLGGIQSKPASLDLEGVVRIRHLYPAG